ncbi:MULTISPECIES: diaminopimelate epimerase [unclassified Fibrobacter]|uniref:diaminopimelate epimerase n=1 Tax=unclassified Fibrobacter TaxID=2634177 RepID=UPI000D79A94D|nr:MULTISPECIES: diaminopimelate epimerase [unclassified Fibrobacter]PWJ61728.1 diaminopimelate epimerase [Fibrobacter sp. UWR4]PZW67384.1 diaminopimelate epimerase [Fibrobacter sp. UWR1]
MSLKFSKWTGLGNDFVLVEPGESFDMTLGKDLEQRVIELCDRRFGIGADGVVVVTPLKSSEEYVVAEKDIRATSDGKGNGIDFEMRIFNADGSEAAMCGNATRCVAKFIVSRGLGNGTSFVLHTKSGLIKPTILDDGRVCVDMGAPRDFLGTIKLTANTFDFTGETVSMGNPHTVIFVDDIDKVELENWGPVLEHDKQFPDRCNIEFAQVMEPGKIRMRVWERGCGITMACGTGSCATLVAAQRTNRVGLESDVILDGGTLHIKHEEGGPVLMTGPAKECFRGNV